jgi:heme exporter protein A
MGFQAVEIAGEGLACVRGGRSVFRGLDFRARPGRLLEIAGANGAGKSSLLRIVSGLMAPAEGRLTLSAGGKTVDEAETPRGGFVCFLTHQDGLKAQMSVRENLAFAAAFAGTGAGVSAALERTGLARMADLPAGYCSAGQKRRAGLARALLSGRPVWLLDEPLAALDAEGRALMRGLIEGHLAEGGTVLAATHDPILEGADRLTVGEAR